MVFYMTDPIRRSETNLLLNLYPSQLNGKWISIPRHFFFWGCTASTTSTAAEQTTVSNFIRIPLSFTICSQFLLFAYYSRERERKRESERERTISLFDQILGKIFFDVWSVVEKKKTILRNFRKMIFGHTSRKCSISDLSKIKKHNMCLYWETNWPVDRGCIQHHRTLVQSSNPIHLWQNDAQWHKMLTNYAHYLIYAGKWPKISPEKQNFTNNVYIKSHWHPNCQYCV